MHKIRVGVLRGGPSSEFDVSLKTGQSVLRALGGEHYELKDILIDRDGQWHLRGFPVEPVRALDQIDVVFNALHGRYGEDGTLQRFLDSHGVRYTGSGALASAIAMNKMLTKEYLKEAPYKHAAYKVLTLEVSDAEIAQLYRNFMQPSIVKPIDGGSSVATARTHSFEELRRAIMHAFGYSDRVLVEQYVRGREATVAVADKFRGEELYAFPPIEISYGKSSFFDYSEKYEGHARELCPAPFPRETTRALIEAAKHVHKTLGLRDYSRSDFIVAKDGIYFLEVNTLPGLTEASLVPKAVHAVGANLPLFLRHVVGRALERK